MADKNMLIGAGCFWCIEAAFNQIEGVTSAISGYCGGSQAEANYKDVCSGTTEHVEVVHITFDDEKISFTRLLYLFFSLHDATQLNQQGHDVGTQYRSVIFYYDQEQYQIAIDLIKQCNQQLLFSRPIVTAVEPATTFYAAEDYHQNYYLKNPNKGYCMAVIAPKFEQFKAQYVALLK